MTVLMDLEAVLSAYLSPDQNTSLKTALSGVEDLNELVIEARKVSQDLYDSKKDGELSDDDVRRMEAITEVITSAVTQRDAERAALDKANRVEAAKTALDQIKVGNRSSTRTSRD
jgi:hypothetical protein